MSLKPVWKSGDWKFRRDWVILRSCMSLTANLQKRIPKAIITHGFTVVTSNGAKLIIYFSTLKLAQITGKIVALI